MPAMPDARTTQCCWQAALTLWRCDGRGPSGWPFLVAYRFSGSVPEILATSRLILRSGKVTLLVEAAARAPDSEALMSRLRLLAKAVGASEVANEEGG